ncbi:uncharacterized protein LOC142984956 isoform X2 [Anticarsia gemmatalis]|uniref:uncharacterized protein LOC142984956 isoform X2 n=1 Tax=Anticarsia gemmatalis TaxID=129554 RepID=UPI003F7730DE
MAAQTEAKMSSSKSKGPIFDPGLCRCCGNMKKCRVINIEYESLGQKEVYTDMIMDCYGLLMSNLDGAMTERLICATCVTRIRDALSFRRQVLRCEEAFIQMKIYDASCEDIISTSESVDALGQTKNHFVQVEIVKTEPLEMEADDHDAGEPLPDVPEDDLKPDLNQDSNSNDDLPLKPPTDKPATKPIVKKRLEGKSRAAASLASQIRMTRKNFAEKVRKPAWRSATKEGKQSLTPGNWNAPVKNDLQMSTLQQKMREKDPSYMKETNILTIVEFSYVCPFKCRHNHLLCYYCGELFSDPILLRDHTITSHHPKKFKVTEHRSMIKVDLTRIDCRLCAAKIDNLDDFRTHITSVHNKKYYFDYKDSVLPFKLTQDGLKCAICGVIFPYFHALNKHMNEHFSNYVCETCGLGFVDHARFVMHQQRHEVGEYPCATCGKVFKAQYNHDLHVDRVHRKRGRVYCPKCDVKLMSYPQKLKHLVEVHGEEPLSFPCDMCDRVFDSRRILTIHKRKEHLKDYRYECQCCGQKFFTRFALNNHMPTHTGERNFKCKVCDKCYPRLKTLKDHMRIHTNDRRYRCHVCAQAFIQNCSLKGHMKSQHPEYG